MSAGARQRRAGNWPTWAKGGRLPGGASLRSATSNRKHASDRSRHVIARAARLVPGGRSSPASSQIVKPVITVTAGRHDRRHATIASTSPDMGGRVEVEQGECGSLMADLVNLRAVRKRAKRQQAEQAAAANRAKHGRSKAERSLERSRSDQALNHLEQHRIKTGDGQ